ncbi:MAG: hypothetical protein AAF264_04675, partial [Pseudomonadota bacterium]
YGNGGNDYLYGDVGGVAGEDTLYGGADDDYLDGGEESDELHGGTGDDTIRGGEGDDLIVGLSGEDEIDGGGGNDRLDVSDLTGTGSYGVYVDLKYSDTFYNYTTAESGSIANVEEVIGTPYNDVVFMGDSDSWFDGGGGDDYWQGGTGADYYWGGTGTDTASYANAASGVRVALQSFNSDGTGEAKDDVLLQVENLHGSGFDDHLTGDSQNNVIRGNGGRDVINALTGSDTVYGGSGADTFVFQESYTVTHGRSSTTYTDRGDDVVKDYVDDVDRFEFIGYSASEISITTSGADAIIHAGFYVDIRVEDAANTLDMGDLLFA